MAFIFGFKNQTDCNEAALEVAKDFISTALTPECRDVIEGVAFATDLLLPPPPLSYCPPPLTELEASSEEEESEDELDNTLSTIDFSYNPFTLKFTNSELEEAFTASHNSNLFWIDTCSYFLTLLIVLYNVLSPSSIYYSLYFQEGIQMWRCYTPQLPFILAIAGIFSPKFRSVYLRHREHLISFTHITALQWQLHKEHGIRSLPAAYITRPVFMNGFGWLAIAILLFRLRFQIVLPLAFICYIVDITLLPKICASIYPMIDPRTCIGVEILKNGFFVVVVPLFLVWCVEKRSRVAFLKRLQ